SGPSRYPYIYYIICSTRFPPSVAAASAATAAAAATTLLLPPREGRDRQGVRNPSRYLNNRVEKLTVPLGVEQGIAMELAVSLGVVLNNDALDELASIPRKESHAIIRELAKGSHGSDPMSYVMEEVYKCREYFKSLTNDENDDFEVQD
ncbi:unnamed protein product, partial [Cladocopium goreaui]